MRINSGIYWVSWANINAKNSKSLDDLASPFKENVTEFINALKDAGASVRINATRRSQKRAYLFHWSWLIALGKIKPSQAALETGVDINWNLGDDSSSVQAAKEIVNGFGLAVPPHSNVAPSLHSNHIIGKAIDMDITWTGTVNVAKKDGTKLNVHYTNNARNNPELLLIGESYGVYKLKTDKPHWSYDGR
ncbi:hypothetical protein FBALC1_08813 [Flavobacteriales bacterium ALC-1]|nr:hypothetical protein FBALC1_08813 [Flavobacteriales bacterium ALC-1]